MRHPDAGSFYDLLGVDPDASPGEIRAAFLRLAHRHHPDLNAEDLDADHRFKQIRRVYEILRDPLKRAAYDDHPHHFRLNDADFGGDNTSPIITRPQPTRRSGAPWPASNSPNGPHDYHPGWLPQGRFAVDKRLMFIGAFASMATVAAICALLISWQRQSVSGDRGGAITAELTERRESPSDSREEPDELSPLEQVITSVRDLRGRTAVDGAPVTSNRSDSVKGTAKEPTASRPALEIMDELNLPDAGWPAMVPPLPVPAIDRSLPHPSDDASLFSTSSESMVGHAYHQSTGYGPPPASAWPAIPPSRSNWATVDAQVPLTEVDTRPTTLPTMSPASFPPARPNTSNRWNHVPTPLPAPMAVSQPNAPLPTTSSSRVPPSSTFSSGQLTTPPAWHYAGRETLPGAPPGVPMVLQNFIRRVSAQNSFAGHAYFRLGGMPAGDYRSTPDGNETMWTHSGPEYATTSLSAWPSPPPSSPTIPTTLTPSRPMSSLSLSTQVIGAPPGAARPFPSAPAAGLPRPNALPGPGSLLPR